MPDMTTDQIVDALSSLTALQLVELKDALEDKWGVTAAAPMAMAAMPGMGVEAAAAEEEQTEFTLVLTSFGEKKIQVIKEVRAMTGLGLKEAKDLVEGVPANIKEDISKEEAEELKAKIEAVGGLTEIK